MPINYSISSPDYDIIISGMGPAALATAREAATLGKRVLIVSNRSDDFLRVQTIYLTPTSRQYLLKMKESEIPPLLSDVEQDKYATEITDLAGIPIKDIERYLLERINKLPTTVDIALESEITSVNFTDGYLQIRSKNNSSALLLESENFNDFKDIIGGSEETSIGFNYLICADGAKHQTINLVNDHLPKIKKVNYKSGPTPKFKHHFSAYLQVSRLDERSLLIPDNKKNKKKVFDLMDVGHAKLLKSDENCLFIIFINRFSVEKSEGKQVKISFSGEVPERIANIKDIHKKEQAMLVFLNDLLSKNFFKHINPNNLLVDVTAPSRKHGVKKDQLKLTFFETHGAIAEQAIMKMQNRYVLIVGDAFLSSNYQTGFGLNDALADAIAVGELLSKQFISRQDMKIFSEKLQIRHKNMQAKTRKINLAATIPHLGKSAMARFSWINQKEMKKWMQSLPVAEQKISNTEFRSGTYFTRTSAHKVKLFANTYADVSREAGIFVEIKKAILSAERFIFISSWCISLVQDIGLEENFGQLLMDANHRGVKVFILAWRSSFLKLNQSRYDENMKFLYKYRPTNIFYKKCIQDGNAIDNIFLTHHQKFIITEEKAFVCGMNFTSKSVDSIEHADSSNIMWHDAGVMLEGSIREDLFNQFCMKWEEQAGENMAYNADNIASEYLKELVSCFDYTSFDIASDFREEDCSVQLLVSNKISKNNDLELARNFGLFSRGISRPSNEIHQGMIEAINHARNYIFISSQYFIGCDNKHEDSANLLSLALIKRIQLAHLNNEDFHIYFTITAYPSTNGKGLLADSIVSAQWESMCYLIKKINDRTNQQAEKFITFTELGKYDEKNNKYYQVYVHSKFLLTPDEVIIGSANLNERSLTDGRDAECSIRIRGYDKSLRKFTADIIIEYFGSEIYKELVENDLVDQLGSRQAQKIVDAYLDTKLGVVDNSYEFVTYHVEKEINRPYLNASDEILGCAMPWGLIPKKDLLALEKPPRVPEHMPHSVEILNRLGAGKYTR